ncbi:hypothetical protein LshimejAT787_0400830 [Lyophyllum shimeji]|uniref:SHSP domain-containing protein n=1 Tax=Lyophyllum shimeji TaxID=47721 RepID=A0A9P3UL50_LYOSH|nr:hypothetical protein LshimejAT787_0400830 [Lyophyllum shimeji]
MDRSTTPPTGAGATTDTSLPHPRPSPDSQQLSAPPPAAPTRPRPRQARPSNPRMEPGSLLIPPAPTASDLPVDKELLQRWSSSNISNDTSTHQRPPSFTKRHASFDSPREVPLPSPSLSVASLSPRSTLAPALPSHFSNFSSSGTTPSASTTVSSHTNRIPPTSPRTQDVRPDYFPAQLPADSSSLNTEARQPASSSSSSGSGSSSQSRYSASSSSGNSGAYHGGRYPVFEEDHSNAGSASDWTSQTSAPSSPKTDSSCGLTDSASGSAGGPSADRTHSRPSSTQFDNMGTAASEANATKRHAMTQMASHPPSQASTSATNSARTTTIATPIFPYSRPYSLPGTSQNTQKQPSKPPDRTHAQPAQPPVPEPAKPSTYWPDRSSSASLPLPAQVPFYTLPRAGMAGSDGLSALDAGIGAGLGRLRMIDGETRDAGDAHARRVREAIRNEVGEHASMHQQRQDHYPYDRGAVADPSSSNSSSSYEGSSDGTGSDRGTLGENGSDTLGPYSSTSRRRRSPSPFRAPQPPPRPFTSPSHLSALARSFHDTHAQAASQSSSSTSGPAVFAPPSYPAPEPPTILAPTVTSPGPFLSHAPPPPDSWIEVETTHSEYRLVVRLPGFKRDGITLATKRRRILHVVADSWENGGGHFERRISFGYDADLVQSSDRMGGVTERCAPLPAEAPPIKRNRDREYLHAL